MTKPILVVINTFNGKTFLKNCIESLKNCEHDTKLFDVVINNNNSTDEETIKFLSEIKNTELNGITISVIDNPDAGYDSGGYRNAYNMFQGQYAYYLFVHDDVLFLHDWVAILLMFLQTSNSEVYIFEQFRDIWDPEPAGALQKEFVKKYFDISELPKQIYCPVGPMFFTSDEVMQKLKNSPYWYTWKITNKTEQQAMERGWGFWFNKLNITVGSPCYHNNHEYFRADRNTKNQPIVHSEAFVNAGADFGSRGYVVTDGIEYGNDRTKRGGVK